MNLLERYIAKTLILATGLASLIIMGVVLLLSLLGELKNIGQGDYGLQQVLLYAIMRLPNDLYQFSPMLILLGSMIGLSILSSNRELAVMRTAGFSIQQIIRTVLSTAFILVLLITLFGESLGPHLSAKSAFYKDNAQNGGQAVVTASGVWFHVEHNFIHVQQVIGRDRLHGVTRYEFDGHHHLLAAYYAKTLARHQNQWVMQDAVKTVFTQDRTQSTHFAEAPWQLAFNPNLLHTSLIEPNNMSLRRLLRFTEYLQQNGLQSTEYQYQFWQRLFQPFAALVMVFLAIPFVLTAFRSHSLGWRMLFGILAGFAFFILNAFLGQLCIVYQLPTVVAAFAPILLFAILGFILTKSLLRQ